MIYGTLFTSLPWAAQVTIMLEWHYFICFVNFLFLLSYAGPSYFWYLYVYLTGEPASNQRHPGTAAQEKHADLPQPKGKHRHTVTLSQTAKGTATCNPQKAKEKKASETATFIKGKGHARP